MAAAGGQTGEGQGQDLTRVFTGALWRPWGKQTGVEVRSQETGTEVTVLVYAGDEGQVTSGRVY